ncbi:MAG: hypothetical protein KGO96_07680 [Elusimicrobia bacterium]|nr:hypothetical protein [Elusimicrobiota bacterium]
MIKKTLEDCYALADKNNGYCLDLFYINATTKMSWRCKEGHIFKMTFGNVNQGRWCKICYLNNHKKSLEDCHRLANLKDGTCLSDEYINCRTKMLWKCINGHEFFMTLNNVSCGEWCKICCINKFKNSLEDCKRLAESREGFFLSR